MAEAVERLGQAVRDGWGAGYDASVVRGLSKSTLDGYLGALAKLRRRERMPPGCDRRHVLEDELGDIAAQNVGEGNIKKLLSGVRLLEKLGWIKSTVRPGDLYLDLGVEKERERQGRGAVKEWASMEALRYMAGVVHTKTEWEILVLAALSCAHCLRASEAIRARAEGGELVFRGTKSRSGEQRQEMGQWTAKWAAFLARLRARHGYHPDVPAWFQGMDGLHSGLHSILERPGGSFKYLRWHSFRRFGAAQLHGLGLPVRFIMLWGGWKSATVAEIYYKVPPRWQFERGGPIPLPEYGTSATTARMQPGTTLGMWPSWIRSELEIPHVRLAWAEPSPEGGTATVQKRSRTESPKRDVVEIEDSPERPPPKIIQRQGRGGGSAGKPDGEAAVGPWRKPDLCLFRGGRDAGAEPEIDAYCCRTIAELLQLCQKKKVREWAHGFVVGSGWRSDMLVWQAGESGVESGMAE